MTESQENVLIMELESRLFDKILRSLHHHVLDSDDRISRMSRFWKEAIWIRDEYMKELERIGDYE